MRCRECTLVLHRVENLSFLIILHVGRELQS